MNMSYPQAVNQHNYTALQITSAKFHQSILKLLRSPLTTKLLKAPVAYTGKLSASERTRLFCKLDSLPLDTCSHSQEFTPQNRKWLQSAFANKLAALVTDLDTSSRREVKADCLELTQDNYLASLRKLEQDYYAFLTQFKECGLYECHAIKGKEFNNALDIIWSLMSRYLYSGHFTSMIERVLEAESKLWLISGYPRDLVHDHCEVLSGKSKNKAWLVNTEYCSTRIAQEDDAKDIISSLGSNWAIYERLAS